MFEPERPLEPPEPEALLTCDHCGEVIYEGDEYFQIDLDHQHIGYYTVVYCRPCAEEWLERRKKIARRG